MAFRSGNEGHDMSHGIASIISGFIGSARSCDIGFGLARLALDFPSGRGQDRRRAYDGMHAFVYTPVFCVLASFKIAWRKERSLDSRRMATMDIAREWIGWE